MKKSKKFKILFWSQESKKTIIQIFPIFNEKVAGNPGISSETTRESGRLPNRVPGRGYRAGYSAGYIRCWIPGWIPGQIPGRISGWISSWISGRISGRTSGWISGQTSGQRSGWTSGQTSSWTPCQTSGGTSGWTSGWTSRRISGYHLLTYDLALRNFIMPPAAGRVNPTSSIRDLSHLLTRQHRIVSRVLLVVGVNPICPQNRTAGTVRRVELF